jgi:hypothetical protein
MVERSEEHVEFGRSWWKRGKKAVSVNTIEVVHGCERRLAAERRGGKPTCSETVTPLEFNYFHRRADSFSQNVGFRRLVSDSLVPVSLNFLRVAEKDRSTGGLQPVLSYSCLNEVRDRSYVPEFIRPCPDSV